MVVMAEYDPQLFGEIRSLLLQSQNRHLEDKAPNGAQPTFWMFVLPGGPKDHYNEVYPGIFIGDKEIASNIEKLQKENITHVLNCAQGTKFNQINTSSGYFKNARIQYYGIKANDISTFKMAPEFDKAAEFLDNALKDQGNKVYVHCHQGISRSATIVLAFLMLKRGMTLIEALKTVRDHRAVHPNDGFVKQLCILNRELYEKQE
ncbi:dual specificity protein phosphatase 3-like isoform X1 [Mytilus californianus]|uniref:dual specificity protein phosphatase 3-like isoform X1 n=2 Tax=Mytilus californianus TaxID=6549 RepID=UPI002247B01B|nr:dual specificity protein phosphatase 3-like isoform X1 [Mytilus californianus]